MSRLRIMIAELEGDEGSVQFEGSVQSVIGACLALVAQGAPSEPIKQIAAPVADLPPVALPSAPADRPTPQAAPPKARGAGKPKRASASDPVPPAAVRPDSNTVVAIIQSLAKGPLTSAQVVAKSGYSDGSVYPALKRLRDEGRIEMISDESDGLRKNRLKAS